MKEKDFLYIDILGFSQMVREHSAKIPQVFKIIDELSVFEHFAFHAIVFSDTILVYNKDENKPNHYYVTYLIEFAQQLFYRLLSIGVFFRGLITNGEFEFHKLRNTQAYWGNALIDTYNDEKNIEGFGLFVRKDLSNDILVFEKMSVGGNYDYVFLCQSYMNLYKRVHGKLPVDSNLLTEIDEFDRIDEDLKFFREISFLKEHHPCVEIRGKYQTVYDWYKEKTPKFFKVFEEQGFLPFVLNPGYYGSINPFEIIAEQELTTDK
jgi:hypothetical protein